MHKKYIYQHLVCNDTRVNIQICAFMILVPFSWLVAPSRSEIWRVCAESWGLCSVCRSPGSDMRRVSANTHTHNLFLHILLLLFAGVLRGSVKVRIYLGKASCLTSLWGFQVCAHRVDVRSLVFGAIAGVAEGFLTAGLLTHVGFLARVTPQMDFQVLQAGKRLLTALKLGILRIN